MLVRSLLAPAIVLLACTALTRAGSEDWERGWPQWRGPLAAGVAPHGDPPTQWAEDRNIEWKAPLSGQGHATPIVWKDRVFLLSAVGDAAPDAEGGQGGRRRPAAPSKPLKFVVSALDLATGKTIWETTVREATPHEGMHPTSTYASASPCTDGERIYASFGSQGLYCLDWSGKMIWEKDLGDLQIRMQFGEGSSPALHGDTLVVVWDHEGDDFIAALDKTDGNERWRKPRDEMTAWATPVIVDAGASAQVLVNATQRIRAYDLRSGETIWETSGMTQNVIPSPVCSDGMAYFLSGFRGAAIRAVKLAEAHGDISNTPAVVWTYDTNTPYVPSPLLVEGCLYFLDNTRAILTCLDAGTGTKHYGPQRLDGLKNIYASPVAAAGRIYIADRDGGVAVLKAGTTYESLAVNTLDDGFDASPAIVGNRLLLRGHKHLYCISEKH